MRRTTFLFATASLLAAGAAHASGGAQGESSFGPVIFQAINLAILLGIIVHYAKGPIRRSLHDRAAQVTKDIDEAGRLNAEAAARLKEYEERLAGLKEAADEIVAEMRREGEAEKARLIAEAEADAERIRKEAERAVSNEIARAKARLEQEIAAQSIAAAERIVREKLVPADHRRLAGEYLSRLEEHA